MEEDKKAVSAGVLEQEADVSLEKVVEGDDLSSQKLDSNDSAENGARKDEVPETKETKTHKIQIWSEIRPSLCAIEDMMSIRVKKKSNLSKDEQGAGTGKPLPSPVEEFKSSKGVSEEDSEDEFYDAERSDPVQDAPASDTASAPAAGDVSPSESLFPWKEELEVLVRGGVPMALRGEVQINIPFCYLSIVKVYFLVTKFCNCIMPEIFQLWQAFVGVRARRVDNYYQDLLTQETNSGNNKEQNNVPSDNNGEGFTTDSVCMPEKWKGQIEKVITSNSYSTLVFNSFISWIYLLCVYNLSNFLNFLLLVIICRICLEHFQGIPLWMRMVEML